MPVLHRSLHALTLVVLLVRCSDSSPPAKGTAEIPTAPAQERVDRILLAGAHAPDDAEFAEEARPAVSASGGTALEVCLPPEAPSAARRLVVPFAARRALHRRRCASATTAPTSAPTIDGANSRSTCRAARGVVRRSRLARGTPARKPGFRMRFS
jgi:hypothetical protein